MSACVCLGKWDRSAQEGYAEVSGSHRRKCHCKVGNFHIDRLQINVIVLKQWMSVLRFLIKSKTQKDEEKTEVTRPAATPTTPPANEMRCSPPPPLDALPSMPASTAEVPLQNPSSRGPVDTQVPPGDLATSTLPDQQEEASASQSQAEQSSPPVVGGREDGEEAGPSGLNTPSTSSLSATCASAFIPFSGGGQRLGGPGASEVGRTPASSSTLSSQSALNAAVDSPKAKKAKSSHGSGKVSAVGSLKKKTNHNLFSTFIFNQVRYAQNK